MTERNEKDQDYGRASEVAKDGPSPRVAEWQPIETAPYKDFVEVLLLVDDSPLIGQWLPKTTWNDGEQDGWYDQDSDKVNPTDWMPLPKRPATKSEVNHDAGENESSTDKPCPNCHAYHQDDVLIEHETCDRPNCTGKANPSPPTQPDREKKIIVDWHLNGDGRAYIAVGDKIFDFENGDDDTPIIEAIKYALTEAFLSGVTFTVNRAIQPPVAQPVPIQGEGDALMPEQREAKREPEAVEYGTPFVPDDPRFKLRKPPEVPPSPDADQKLGPWKEGDRIQIAPDTHTGDNRTPLTEREAAIANIAARIEACHEATLEDAVPSSKDQVVEAAAAHEYDLIDVDRILKAIHKAGDNLNDWLVDNNGDPEDLVCRDDWYPEIERITNALATALNPNSETEKENG